MMQSGSMLIFWLLLGWLLGAFGEEFGLSGVHSESYP